MIDAIASDLEDNGDLPAHKLVKYVRPPAILPAQCPLLVVWYVVKAPLPEETTNARFGSVLAVSSSWHFATVEAAKNLRYGEEPALALDAISKIEQRIHALSRDRTGFPDEAYEMTPGLTRPEEPQMKNGLVHGWVVDAEIRLSETTEP